MSILSKDGRKSTSHCQSPPRETTSIEYSFLWFIFTRNIDARFDGAAAKKETEEEPIVAIVVLRDRN